MIVFVNNRKEEIASRKLVQLLDKLDLNNRKGIAVAVNDSVISRSNWEGHLLNENDKITVIKATQGG